MKDLAVSKTTTESVSHAHSNSGAETKTEHENSTMRLIDRDISNGDSGANHDISFGSAKPLQHVPSIGRQDPVLGGGSIKSRTRPPALSRVDSAKADGTRSSLDTTSPHSLTSALGPDVAPDRLDVASEDNHRNGMSNGLKKLRHTLRS
jgi:hypothetical protein